MAVCYYDGKFMPVSECTIPVTDMSIQRGVGAFDSIRVYDGRTFAIAAHLKRLEGSAIGSGVDIGEIFTKLPTIIKEGLKRDDAPKNGIVKPYITGGDINNKGHFPNPRFFVIFDDLHRPTSEERKNGVALEPNRVGRAFPLIKSTNYLCGLIPLSKRDDSFFESLYITPEGEISEAMTSNFFLCIDGKVITAPVGKVLKGVTRDIVLTLAEENGIEVIERCPLESELAKAEEAFTSSSIKEVLPIVKVGEQIIGDGKPGPITLRLHNLFTANIHRWLDE
ncbi:MAG: aminotransferase IV [Synergistaceae bacterium]|nr:aminotransferase IV [Synergistaceae bacterium]